MTRDTRTLAVYAERTGDYLGTVSGDPADPSVQMCLNSLPAPGDVLDLGCGPGHHAATLRDAGHRVTATDASPEMCAAARDHYGIEAQVAGFADLDAVARYDAVLASFSLLHAPKSQMPAHLAAVHRALRPGGTLVIGMKGGEGEHRDRLGRFYAYYSEPELSGLLEGAGFRVTERATGAAVGLDGTLAPWIVLAARA